MGSFMNSLHKENKSISNIDFKEEQESNESDELFEHHRFVADAGQRPLRIDRFLANRIINVSRTKIQDAAQAGYILVNNKAVKSNYKVKPGDHISVMMDNPPRELEIIPEDIPLNIVFEDDAFIIINKEPGMVVHPGYGNYSGTLVNALAWHFKGQEWFNTNDPRPGLVHRIDKDTSGLLVVAKTENAKMKLAQQFFDKTSRRVYQAIVWGTPEPDEGTISENIGRSVRDRKLMTVYEDGEQGKPAVTHYKTIEKLGYISLLECYLETGRTHQIRTHLKFIGHPIFNDEKYGGGQILKGTTFSKYRLFVQNCFSMLPRQALHAGILGFNHPVSGKYIEFKSDLPDDMASVLEKWRSYISSRNEWR